MANIFSRIREQAELICENARWVNIDTERLLSFADRLQVYGLPELEHTAEHHYLDHGEDTLAYFLILDSINFGSGYFPYLKKEEGFSGYFTIANGLKKYFEQFGPPEASLLEVMNPETCAAMLGGQDVNNPHMAELMFMFSCALQELGRFVNLNYKGRYVGILEQARSAQDVVAKLIQMPMFRDIVTYGNIEVPFLKRAQIFLQDVKLALPNHKLTELEGLDDLTIFADNVVPFVLEAEGILKYHPWLSERIGKEELIAYGSCEEIEMRASSIHACDVIARIISDEYRQMSVRELDFHIWNRGQQLKSTSTKKRHRTRCVYY